MMDPRVAVRLVAHVEAFAEAMRKLVRAVEQYVVTVRCRFPWLDAELRRLEFGPRNAIRHDGRLEWWQSDLCAAWLHESCPAPDLCDCRCSHAERQAAS